MTINVPSIFFVTTVVTDNGNFKNSRCWGYYYSLDDARHNILINNSDIHECDFDFALIEEMSQGIMSYIATPDLKKVWFHWEEDGYREVEEPEFAKDIVGWSCG